MNLTEQVFKACLNQTNQTLARDDRQTEEVNDSLENDKG